MDRETMQAISEETAEAKLTRAVSEAYMSPYYMVGEGRKAEHDVCVQLVRENDGLQQELRRLRQQFGLELQGNIR